MSRFLRFSFFVGITLGVAQFLLVIGSGSYIAGAFWGVVPVWFWATYQKLQQDTSVSALEGIASYGIVIYGGIMALVTVLFLLGTIGFLLADPEIIQAALEQQPNFDDMTEQELEEVNKVVEWLPSLMPLLTLAACLQAVSYLRYGVAVVKNYSR